MQNEQEYTLFYKHRTFSIKVIYISRLFDLDLKQPLKFSLFHNGAAWSSVNPDALWQILY